MNLEHQDYVLLKYNLIVTKVAMHDIWTQEKDKRKWLYSDYLTQAVCGLVWKFQKNLFLNVHEDEIVLKES